MSYVSPIKIGYTAEPEEGWTDKIGKYIAGEVDNLVLESCVKVGCHVDKDELEKALRYDRDQYDRGYADGKRDAASPWHRVEEPPKEYGNYLAVVNGEVMEVTYSDISMRDDWNWSTCDAEGFVWIRSESVTHWMPLPEPPKEGKDA